MFNVAAVVRLPGRRRLIVTIGIVATACSTSPPNPTPSVAPPTVPPGSPGPVDHEPTNRPQSTPTFNAPPTPTPTPALADLHVNGLATVAVGRLRQFVDPVNPRANKPFTGPSELGGRRIVPLAADQLVYLVDGPRLVDGREFWKVADDDYVGCCAPLGWVPTLSSDGEPTLEPLAPACPDPSELSAQVLIDLGRRVTLSCFGSTALSFEATVNCDWTHGDSYVSLSGPGWTYEPPHCWLSADPANEFTVVGDAVTALARNLPQRPYSGRNMVTGHFDEATSELCRWAMGSLGSIIPPEGAPIETAQLACRHYFYVTAVAALE